ncbi:cytochrome b5-like [Sycon ciliatum]|uniref:cytochrome b5-like n=1 Tax=Sycon ciliatum TaxID=27933 RepID=UPI0020AE663F|eukprot:scpid97821/ scgid31487/ Cytochrome b5
MASTTACDDRVAQMSPDSAIGTQDELPSFTRQEVAKHGNPFSDTGCWVVVDDYVYDITQFIHEHPGGFEILLEHAGRDASTGFNSINHSSKAKQRLATLRIGKIVKR